jgi:hypothetical protein
MMTRIGFVAACMVLLSVKGEAETFRLRDGRTLDGQIIRTNDVSVTIRTSSGVQTYALSELGSGPEPPSTVALSGQPPPTTAPHSPTTGVPAGDWDRSMRGFFLHGLLTVRAGQIIWLLGSILLLVQGFRTHPLWGILVLLTNLLGAVLFLIFHPKQAIVPLLIMLVGIVVFAMAPFWALWGAGAR